MTRRTRGSRFAAALAAALVLAGLAGPAAAAPVAAVDSDQPCTRRPPVGAVLQDTGLRPDDLARMVLPKTSLGTAARGYAVEYLRYGYMDNTEWAQVEIAPTGMCAVTKTYGRILGFSGAYESATSPWRYVSTGVHQFFSAADASAWLRTLVARMRAQVGTGAIRRLTVTSLPAVGAGAVRLQVGSPDGVRTWVLFPRGPIVGSLLHFRPGTAAATVDVTALAPTLRQRIDTVLSQAAARTEQLDSPLLLSLPLPKAALGSRYASLTWSWFFGGCTDVVEAASRAANPADARADASRYGRLVACSGMYEPPQGTPINGVSRVVTSASLYATAEGAAGALSDAVADQRRVAGTTVQGTSYGAVTTFSTPSLGEHVVGVQQRIGSSVRTKILFRRGRLLLQAWLDTVRAGDAGTEVRRIATAFDTRVGVLLGRNT